MPATTTGPSQQSPRRWSSRRSTLSSKEWLSSPPPTPHAVSAREGTVLPPIPTCPNAAHSDRPGSSSRGCGRRCSHHLSRGDENRRPHHAEQPPGDHVAGIVGAQVDPGEPDGPDNDDRRGPQRDSGTPGPDSVAQHPCRTERHDGAAHGRGRMETSSRQRPAPRRAVVDAGEPRRASPPPRPGRTRPAPKQRSQSATSRGSPRREHTNAHGYGGHRYRAAEHGERTHHAGQHRLAVPGQPPDGGLIQQRDALTVQNTVGHPR
jgi:hypothetical protein